MIRLPIRCICCDKVHELYVDKKAYSKYKFGEGHVQTLFPDLSAGQRELLISQTCESCFDNLFEFECNDIRDIYDDEPF